MKFKNQNPARGRKLLHRRDMLVPSSDLRTRTPQGDGNLHGDSVTADTVIYLRTRTPQGDGNQYLLTANVV